MRKDENCATPGSPIDITHMPDVILSPGSEIDLAKLRVAIVHYWFVDRAGGEKVVEALAELFPQADLYALVAEKSVLSSSLAAKTLQTSFLQKIPGASRFHRYFLFLQPFALEQFDLSQYDLVISSESGPAKGVITSSKTCHICYCHSPMRYIWDMYPQYRRNMSPLTRAFFSLTAHYMRLWDLASSQRVDYFVANSRFVASRIRKIYRRQSTVIHPPVAIPSNSSSTSQIDAPYLAMGRLVDYKRFDLAVAACTSLKRNLVIIGEGPERKRLEKIAGPTIQFLGRVSDEMVKKYLSESRALIFPGEEDFGIVPVEAQGYGKPVIAYGSGGALETIKADTLGQPSLRYPTGLFFYEGSVAALQDAILSFEAQEGRFSSPHIREHSLQFAEDKFQKQMRNFVLSSLQDFQHRKYR